jgi:hypothetical protein
MKLQILKLQKSDSNIVSRTLKLITAIFITLISLTNCSTKDDQPIIENPTTQNPTTGTLDLGLTISRDFIGQIIDENSNPISGATVKVGSSTNETDANGFFIIKNASVKTQLAYVTATKTGFLDGSRSLVPTTGTNNVKIMLYSGTATQTINSGSSSTVTLANGTKVVFDGTFKTDSGTAYSGAVSVVVKHLDPSDPKINQKMPGMLLAQNTTGQAQVLKTFGMIDVVLLGSGGQKLQIVNPSQIELPITATQLASAPATIPLWHFDTTTGYWIEEGVATKVGNVYKGTVSHFSWWNCDFPYDKANLTIKVVNSGGSPLANVRVDILPTGYTYAGQGTTNTLGLVSGIIPANIAYDIKIYDTCGNLILTQPQTALATNSTTTLPDIVLTNAVVANTLVTGTLLKCNNTNVTNGYVVMNYGSSVNSVLVTNGTFSFSTLVCTSSTAFTLQGYDYDNLQTTGLINSTFTGANTILGNLTVCTSVTEYITYQIDGGAVNNILSNIKVNNFQGTFLSISGGDAVSGASSFYLGGNSITPGSYTTANGFNLEGNFLVGTSFVSNSMPNTIQFNLNSFGAVGQYVDLTFNGTYTVASVTHTITGSVHALRDM